MLRGTQTNPLTVFARQRHLNQVERVGQVGPYWRRFATHKLHMVRTKVPRKMIVSQSSWPPPSGHFYPPSCLLTRSSPGRCHRPGVSVFRRASSAGPARSSSRHFSVSPVSEILGTICASYCSIRHFFFHRIRYRRRGPSRFIPQFSRAGTKLHGIRLRTAARFISILFSFG